MNGILLVLCLLPALLSASPVEKEFNTVPGVDTLSRLLRIRRQSSISCMNDRDCVADSSLTPPATLVQCFIPSGSSQGECQCSDCFMLNSNGTCEASLCPDYLYNNNSNVCGADSRPSQLTAFLLTLFVASTGAGNFYIGQDALGGGQLFLLLVITLVPCIMCCLPCCLGCCMEKDDVKGSCFFFIIMLVTVLLIIGASLSLSAWWIADVIIFATNQRPAGNGCMLSPWS